MCRSCEGLCRAILPCVRGFLALICTLALALIFFVVVFLPVSRFFPETNVVFTLIEKMAQRSQLLGEQCRRDLAKNDLVGVHESAHELKGASLTIHAIRLAPLASCLSDLTKRKGADQSLLHGLVEAVVREIAKLVAFHAAAAAGQVALASGEYEFPFDCFGPVALDRVPALDAADLAALHRMLADGELLFRAAEWESLAALARRCGLQTGALQAAAIAALSRTESDVPAWLDYAAQLVRAELEAAQIAPVGRSPSGRSTAEPAVPAGATPAEAAPSSSWPANRFSISPQAFDAPALLAKFRQMHTFVVNMLAEFLRSARVRVSTLVSKAAEGSAQAAAAELGGLTKEATLIDARDVVAVCKDASALLAASPSTALATISRDHVPCLMHEIERVALHAQTLSQAT